RRSSLKPDHAKAEQPVLAQRADFPRRRSRVRPRHMVEAQITRRASRAASRGAGLLACASRPSIVRIPGLRTIGLRPVAPQALPTPLRASTRGAGLPACASPYQPSTLLRASAALFLHTLF